MQLPGQPGASTRPGYEVIVVNLSGRGDKDLGIVFSNLKGVEDHEPNR